MYTTSSREHMPTNIARDVHLLYELLFINLFHF